MYCSSTPVTAVLELNPETLRVLVLLQGRGSAVALGAAVVGVSMFPIYPTGMSVYLSVEANGEGGERFTALMTDTFPVLMNVPDMVIRPSHCDILFIIAFLQTRKDLSISVMSFDMAL